MLTHINNMLTHINLICLHISEKSCIFVVEKETRTTIKPTITMNTKKTKLRYVEISDKRMHQFIVESDYPRQYWAKVHIETDMTRTIDYIKWLEQEMDTTNDKFEQSRLIAKRNIAVREFFAQRKCYLAIQEYWELKVKIYEAAHPEMKKPSREELKRLRNLRRDQGYVGKVYNKYAYFKA